jgi:N-acetylmuramoyl-L-alanine amidase
MHLRRAASVIGALVLLIPLGPAVGPGVAGASPLGRDGAAGKDASRGAPAGVHPAAAVRAAAGPGGPVPVAATPAGGGGFWVASADGVVDDEGGAASDGDASGLDLNAPVVDIARSADGGGYWLLSSDGGVFSYGDAAFYGSTGNLALNQPALQMVATPSGRGYWFVARDGGVFAFGDAAFHGSTGGMRLNRPVVGMAATPDGGGYWLVARDGGVFAFGDAAFHGSTGGITLNQPIVGMAATPDGGGYWLVARDGGVFAFGDAAFDGSAGGQALAAPAISIVASPDGGGYWIVLANGSILSFGDAPAIPSSGIVSDGFSLVGQVFAIDPGHDGGNGADPAAINAIVPSGPGQTKACDTTGTETDSGYTEHAFNFDVANRLAADLRARGAAVVLTRTTDTGVGPCVNVRAAIGNEADADAALSIHADGAPAGDRGFAVLLPALFPGFNDAVVPPSDTLGSDVVNAFAAGTPMPISDYDGTDGLQVRDDLGGLNLSTVPKVLIEIGNMKNATDAALETSATFRQQAADALAAGLSEDTIGYP